VGPSESVRLTRAVMMGKIMAILALGLLLFVAPFAVEAEQTQKRYRVGVLTPSASQWQPAVFTQALRDLGYEETVNLTISLRDAGGRLETLPQLATELVRENVDVMVAINTPGTRAAMNATKTIPIVMSMVADPVAMGFVTNLGRPGGNVTGVSNLNRELTAKRLELLKEAVPGAARIAVLLYPDDPVVAPQVEDTKAAAARLGVEPKFFAVRSAEDLRHAFAMMMTWRAQAVLRLAGLPFALSRPTIDLALRHRLPTMLLAKEEVSAGALMSYDSDRAELFRRSAWFVDKILKGARPGDLPVEQPTRFELRVNLRTAKSLGLTIPSSVILQADLVIE
jgi:putative ABC transport system substrate-binding protein